MTGLARRRRIRLVLAATALLAVATTLVGTAMKDGIQFFRTPSQVLADPPGPAETFRIGGMVAAGSVERRGSALHFRVTDGGTDVPVIFEGVPPDLFAEGEGVIATGRLSGGIVLAREVLAKHDETYMPRELAGMEQ